MMNDYEKYLPNLHLLDNSLPEIFKQYDDDQLTASFVEITINGSPVLLFIQHPEELSIDDIKNPFKNMIIAVTGHRPDKLGKEYDMKGPISEKIYRKLCSIVEVNKPTQMITGMALGVDMLFANVAINKNIPFIAAVPCYNQEKKWAIGSQKLYSRIVNDPLCNLHYVTEQEYNPACMQKRNQWIVDRCDVLIAVWNGSDGGTANCVKYASSKDRYIKYVNPTHL